MRCKPGIQNAHVAKVLGKEALSCVCDNGYEEKAGQCVKKELCNPIDYDPIHRWYYGRDGSCCYSVP